MNVRKAIKKPIEIEFIQYNGLNHSEINQFVGMDLQLELESDSAYQAGKGAPSFSITIPTLEGDMKAQKGDYIIKGIEGEFYPCKKSIFEMTYNVL